MSKIEVDTIDTVTGTSELTIGGTNATSITLGSGASFSNVSGQNYPAFFAYQSSAQSISNDTVTKVQFDTEVFDTDNAFDSTTNYRFTPQVAGKYFVYVQTRKNNFSAARFQAVLKLNGSTNLAVSESGNGGTRDNAFSSAVVELNGSSDYLELFTYQDNGSTQDLLAGISSTFFGAYRIGA